MGFEKTKPKISLTLPGPDGEPILILEKEPREIHTGMIRVQSKDFPESWLTEMTNPWYFDAPREYFRISNYRCFRMDNWWLKSAYPTTNYFSFLGTRNELFFGFCI